MPTTPAQQKHYKANRERYIAQALSRLNILKMFIWQIKDRPCTDCGVRYPHYVMDFDHVRGKKVGNISNLAKKGNLPLLIEEIAKCDIVCSNCHRIRTWKRGGYADVVQWYDANPPSW